MDEPLDRSCQCTRHFFEGRAEYDVKRRAKLKAVRAAVAIMQHAACIMLQQSCLPVLVVDYSSACYWRVI
eukprot:COSAG06_NODE_1402_length_9571_cov_8.528294_5_plen_70_part_00